MTGDRVAHRWRNRIAERLGPTECTPTPPPPRFVVHLVVRTPDLAAATVLARAMARSLTFLPELDAGDTTVSVEGSRGVPRRVFCDRGLDAGRRCVRLADHDGQCRPPTSR